MTDTRLTERLEAAGTIVILGHIHPDGDCVGSALGLKNYLKNAMPEKDVRVYLEEPDPKFGFLKGFDEVIHVPDKTLKADLAVAVDVSDRGRLGDFLVMFDNAASTFNVDHHFTNPQFADGTVLRPEASSACEVLYELIRPELIDRDTAACLYTGIVTDTGVFKYQQTSARTMEIAGTLMEKGIPFGEIIDVAFYRKTPVQNRMLGKCLVDSIPRLNGKCLFSVVTMKDKKAFGADHRDLDGVAEQLRLTQGVECSCLISETVTGQWKLSLRSADRVNVAEIAALYGGGGHIRASGCTIDGSVPAEEIMNRIVTETGRQLGETE